MIWCECSPDKTQVEYSTCEICKRFPALALIDTVYGDYEGPFCIDHWIGHVKKQFDQLDKKLEDENWESLPDPFPPVVGKCEMCDNDIYKIYHLRHQQKDYEVCSKCYDKYSEK